MIPDIFTDEMCYFDIPEICKVNRPARSLQGRRTTIWSRIFVGIKLVTLKLRNVK